MNGKRLTLFAVAAAFLIAVVVFLSVFFTGSGEKVEVILPEIGESGDAPADSDNNSAAGIESADITVETVQAVIKTLNRPVSYHRTLESKLFWEDSSIRTSAEIWQKGGLVRLDVTEAGSVKHMILTESAVYIWYNDETEYISMVLPKLQADLLRIADEFSAIPGYETLLQLREEQILQADYVMLEDKPCIYLCAASENYQNREEYYVEIETGLLIAAASYADDSLVYEMKAGATELTAPDDSLFCLPGEEQALTS